MVPAFYHGMDLAHRSSGLRAGRQRNQEADSASWIAAAAESIASTA